MNIENLIPTRQSYGEALAELGRQNEKIVVFDADLSGATKTKIFAKEIPNRFFNMGIAEQDMVSTAAGMATCGNIPYVSSFAVFLAGRAYDQIRASIAYPNQNVKLCATHSGITVGEDGATHQMLEDISLMRTMPNMVVMCTSDEAQTKWAVKEISEKEGPIYLRLSRLATPQIYSNEQKFEFGKGIQHGDGTDATLIVTGVTVAECLKAQKELELEGINARVIDIHTIKPLDKDIIVKSAKETKKIYTVEDHSIIGGLGSAVIEVLNDEYPVKVERIGVKDVFGKSGKAIELLEYYGLDSKTIVRIIKENM